MAKAEGIEAEPRTIRFRTDSLGFRNDGDYKGQKYVLVGDSFIVGSGCSQEDILATLLRQTYGIDTYALAHPGGIPEYVKYMLYFERKYKADFKAFLFLFEGNDFPDAYSQGQLTMKKPFAEAVRDAYRSFFRETILYRYTFSVAATRKKRSLTSRAFTIGGARGRRV